MSYAQPRNSKGFLAAVIAAAVLLGGCGGESSSDNAASEPSGNATSEPPTTTAPTFDADAEGKDLLDRWSGELVPNILVQRDRAKAFQQGDTTEAARLEAKARRQLRRIQKFGSQARTTFVQHLDEPQARAVRVAGDAWSLWAHTMLNKPPEGDFAKAQKIADLAARAVAAHQRAYEAVGAAVPPEFRTAG